MPAAHQGDRSLVASIAANERWANTEDRREAARPLWSSNPSQVSYWADKLDPEHRLTDAERNRRGENARTAHYKRMALKSAQVRRARKAITRPTAGDVA
jgi:hypothetical protein